MTKLAKYSLIINQITTLDNMTKQDVMQDIRKASREIQKRYRYSCGIASDEVNKELGCGDMFFESPDGQNGQLYMELKKLGYRSSGFNAEYFWKVNKDGWIVSYTEGDICIRQVETLAKNKA